MTAPDDGIPRGTGGDEAAIFAGDSNARTNGIARARAGVGNWSMPMKELGGFMRLQAVLRVRAFTAG